MRERVRTNTCQRPALTDPPRTRIVGGVRGAEIGG